MKVAMPATLRQFAVAVLVAAIVFLLLDASWLTIMASRLGSGAHESQQPALE
ncbi:MAG TPA: hypothetical protein VL131_03570 [Gammaproteobacteria bacterium]|nr:hypothetical protein [Gammaproteobacteria bacterium]